MTKYHINKHGVPAICNAQKGKCPLGGMSVDENHYNLLEEAQEAAYQINKEKFNLLPNSEISPEIQEDFINNVYYPANMAEKVDFVVRMDTLDYDGLLPKAVKGILADNFNEKAVIAEIKSDDPLHYSLDSLVSWIENAYDDIGYKLQSEGFDVSLVYDEDYKENLKIYYRDYLKSKQGPVKEVFGKKFAEIEDPYGKDTEQFFKDYIIRHGAPTNTNISPEVVGDFNENVYYHSLGPFLNSYIERMDYLENDSFIACSKNPEAIKQAFKNNFSEKAVIAEIKSDDPLHYSINSLDGGILNSYHNLKNSLENEGYNISSIQKDGDYTENFKSKYRSYLKSKQGPIKELFGRKFAEIENPNSESTKQFFIDYIKRNK